MLAHRVGRQPKEKEKGRTALEERVLLNLLGTVGAQSVLGVTTQQPCDEIPCIFAHFLRELEWIVQYLPVHLRGILYNSRIK